MEREELLNVATQAGSLLLCSGAEIYRVEESMTRIFEAYGVRDSNIFAIPSCIYVTINTPGGAPITRVKRILNRQTNLDRVDKANDVCRRICRECPSFEKAREMLAQVEARPVYGLGAQLAGRGEDTPGLRSGRSACGGSAGGLFLLPVFWGKL